MILCVLGSMRKKIKRGGGIQNQIDGGLVMLEWVWALQTEESESIKGVVGKVNEE